MTQLILVLTVLLVLAMVGTALVAIMVQSYAIAMLSAGLVGLFASVLFLVLGAPDVAMTEAAIGSGLTSFLFFFILGRIRGGDRG
ncbi:Membrane bound protein complex subunit mbxD [Magnetococcus marinus MC-1]|uniref:Membrane bound protein complex subunit mbxD n=1 Tax=Magnetococcus marinus (strain ATCC BAA-1437 / JCM 17883 / MC-1) TaxID=156889 RepID=A0L9S1_MAGMM|nr:DUF4040 domain-containing protein [Magnetococcus marinus]ABK44714.1 Membrane bound protein complex subunit mbxD [Magnetococcus marinus MC-1]